MARVNGGHFSFLVTQPVSCWIATIIPAFRTFSYNIVSKDSSHTVHVLTLIYAREFIMNRVLWTRWLLFCALTVLAPARPVHAFQTGEDGDAPASVTFNKNVAPILQAHCQTCHHPGAIAPFSLITYDDAYARKDAIVYQTQNRTMPPWHVNSQRNDFKDDPSLSDAELATLRLWVESGAPEGDSQDLPAALTFSDGWSFGEPDLVLTMNEPMTPDFSRGDVYRCFVFPTNLSEDRFVSTVEVRPGSQAMVHHVLLFIDTSGKSDELDRADPGPGYNCFGGPGFSFLWALGGWAPGSRARPLPEGVGMYLPKKSNIVMQVHYSARSGKTEPDQSSIGLRFSTTPVQKRLLSLPVINNRFRIPAGESDYKVTASVPFLPFDVHLLGITPHMHLLGKKMTVKATALGGEEIWLVDVPNWDFHWQGTYTYKEQIALKAPSRFDLAAYYDNSDGNPDNPNSPPLDVGWGENTTDEMCIAFVHFTLDLENLTGDKAKAATTLDTFPPFWQVDLTPAASPGRPDHEGKKKQRQKN